jgi:hypothetical protein
MGGMVVLDGKVQRLKVSREVLQDVARLLGIANPEQVQALSVHVRAGRQPSRTGATASGTRASGRTSAAGRARRPRK